MKLIPLFVALIGIGATGFAISPKSVPDRTKTIPLPEPVSLGIDELALPESQLEEFEESVIPEAIRKLNGKRIRIVGQRYAIGGGPVTKFVFNGYTQRKPNFLEHGVERFIPVTLKAGTTTQVALQPIEIEGRFVIRPTYKNGKLTYLYHIEDAVVRPTEQPDGLHQSVLPIFLC